MKVHLKALCLFFLLALLLGIPANAQRNDNTSTKKSLKTSLQNTLIKDHKTLSTLLVNIAERLDIFLARQKLIKTPNKTQVIITNSNTLTEGEGFDSLFNLGVHLHLPNFEKYWQLKFTNYDDQTTDRGVRRSYLKQNTGSRNYGASVGFLRKFKNMKFKFQPRILLEDPLDISHSLSFETELESKILQFEPKLEFFATPKKGTGIFTGLNTGFTLNDTYSIVFVNEFEYQDLVHLFIATQGISFGQILDDISSLSYNLFFISNNRPNYHLNNLNVSVAYNCVLYKDIIDTQLVPALGFSEERDFKGQSSFSVNFNIYF